MNEDIQAQAALERYYNDKFARVYQNIETRNRDLLANFTARVLKRIASYPNADRGEGLFVKNSFGDSSLSRYR